MQSLKTLFLFVFLFGFWNISFSQTDSLSYRNRIRRKPYSSAQHITMRIGTGLQRSFYSELGISLQNQVFGCVGFGANSKYVAVEFIPNLSTNESQFRNVYALKTGIEFNAMC